MCTASIVKYSAGKWAETQKSFKAGRCQYLLGTGHTYNNIGSRSVLLGKYHLYVHKYYKKSTCSICSQYINRNDDKVHFEHITRDI